MKSKNLKQLRALYPVQASYQLRPSKIILIYGNLARPIYVEFLW